MSGSAGPLAGRRCVVARNLPRTFPGRSYASLCRQPVTRRDYARKKKKTKMMDRGQGIELQPVGPGTCCSGRATTRSPGPLWRSALAFPYPSTNPVLPPDEPSYAGPCSLTVLERAPCVWGSSMRLGPSHPGVGEFLAHFHPRVSSAKKPAVAPLGSLGGIYRTLGRLPTADTASCVPRRDSPNSIREDSGRLFRPGSLNGPGACF